MAQHRFGPNIFFRHPLLLTVAATGAAAILLALFYWRPSAADLPRDGAPSWAPDGRTLVFTVELGQADSKMYVMNADGSGRRPLKATSGREAGPAFSPDGAQIAFSGEQDGNPEIYLFTLSGRRLRRLSIDPASDLAPAWSPDGKRLAFMSDRLNRAATDIYTMSAEDGSGLARLTTDRTNWAPQFARNGDIAVQVDRDVFVIDSSTRAMRRLTWEPLNGMNPTWSPDGSQVGFVSTRNGRAEIFTMNPDGSDQRLLVSDPTGSAIDPRWSPDGNRIAFVLIPDQPPAGRPAARQAIYTVELASRRITRLSP